MDLHPMVANYEYRVTNGGSGEDLPLSGDYFTAFLQSKKLKNGFVLTILELSKLKAQMGEIKQKTAALTALISEEVRR